MCQSWGFFAALELGIGIGIGIWILGMDSDSEFLYKGTGWIKFTPLHYEVLERKIKPC